jgi:hypothetical protein
MAIGRECERRLGNIEEKNGDQFCIDQMDQIGL